MKVEGIRTQVVTYAVESPAAYSSCSKLQFEVMKNKLIWF